MQLFTPLEYLKIDISNNFGLDKLDWEDRILWFDQNEPNLENLLSQAEVPALYWAGVKAWRDTQAGKPTGYMISLDATSSGLQLLAALTGDRSAAQLCNVVDTGSREDAYTNIYERMLAKVGDTAKIQRSDVKQAIMTGFYGSTAMPKAVFGEGKLLDTFFDTMKEVAPAAWELNEAFLAIWDPTVTKHSWILPDNFHVHIKVMGNVKDTVHFLNKPFAIYYKENMPVEAGRSLGANTIHSIDGMIVRELTRRCDYDPQVIDRVNHILAEQPNSKGVDFTNPDTDMVAKLWLHYQDTGYLSARILDHLTHDNVLLVNPFVIEDLLDSLPAKPFKVVSIHDCFRVLANYGNDLRRQYNLQLAMIAKSNLLSCLLSQITGQTININQLDPSLHIDIAQSNYALS